ncbi:hypothetical protein SLS64_014142 [Diaporthe eres]|uniref:Heterokaryon incompatibility domain-containing protein n=1 Tax=Diaporthe eres TaxID=83184 RepID=A0ABR1P2X4_DIAER
MIDVNNTGWVGETLAELRSDAFPIGHRLNARTKVTVDLAEGTYMRGEKDGVIDHHLFLHSEPGESPETREWHPTKSLAIAEDPSGTCHVTLNGSGELSWDFKKEGDFFYAPDELLQVVEVTDMCMVEAYGRSVFGRSVLPASFKTLEGKMPKVWATSNVVPDELYGCYEETSDPFLLDAFGLVMYRACEVTDPVGWEVEQTAAGTTDDVGGGSARLQVDNPTWRLPSNFYQPCRRHQGGKAVCTSGKYVYDHSTKTIRPMQEGEIYIAISYAWADLKKAGGDAPLQRAVERLCEKMSVMVFWIDRLCINQKCARHKEEQVPEMGDIYSKAIRVACLLPGVSRVLPDDVREPGLVMRRRDFCQATAVFRAQVKDSFWFRRVWTWQEGLLATRSMFVTTNDMLDGWLVDNILNATRLARCSFVSHIPALPASSNIQSLSLAASSDTQLLYTRTADNDASRELRYLWGDSRRFTLMEAAVATRRRESSRKLDEVFGLLGMVEGGERMTVRYVENETTMDMENVLTEALKIGLMTTEVLSGPSVSNKCGRSWLPNIPVNEKSPQEEPPQERCPHFAFQLGQLNRAGRKIEGNKDGMAVLTGATMPKGCKWTCANSNTDAVFMLESEEGQILASSNNEELTKYLGKPVLVVLLDDVLSHDCYGTFAMMEGTDQATMRRITSSRIQVESAGFSMERGTYVVG